MGCCAARKGYIDEENLQQLAEVHLNFHVNSPQQVAEVFESQESFLTQQGFDLVAARLHLKLSGLREANTPVGRFFRILCSSGLYKTRELYLLSLLLCTGTTAQKAAAYFDWTDTGNLGQVSKVQVRRLLEHLTDLLATALPMLAKDSQARTKRCVEYHRGLSAGRAQTILKLELKIMRGKEVITRAAFIDRFYDDEVAALTSSKQLRLYVTYGLEGLYLGL